MSRRSTCLFSLVAGLLAAIPALAQQKDLTYNAVTPCYVANTFLAGGQFAPNETRIYNVVGSGSLAGQGGSASGCGIPGFSNGVARVQAVALDILVVNPTGAGHIVAIPADTAFGAAPFMNFNAPPPGACCLSVTNEAPVAVAQTSGVGDIKINVAVSGAHLVVSVVGYYTRFGETITVGPGATPAASGMALRNALTSIADNSASKPYLIKLEPGVYDVGATMLVMKPYVDIEGSGQQTTIVQGVGNNSSDLIGVVYGASNAELRNLQAKSLGAGFSYSIGVVVADAGTRVRDVTVVSSGASVNWGVRVVNGVVSGLNPIIERSTVDVQGGSAAYGIVNRGEQAKATVRDSAVKVSAATNAYGFYTVGGSPQELTRLKIDASGTSTATGVFGDPEGVPITLRLSDSTVTASGGSSANYGARVLGGNADFVRSTLSGSDGGASYGIFTGTGFVTANHCELTGATNTVVASSVTAGATRLSGGPVSVFSSATCAGVYDENYTFFASTCP